MMARFRQWLRRDEPPPRPPLPNPEEVELREAQTMLRLARHHAREQLARRRPPASLHGDIPRPWDKHLHEEGPPA